MSKKIILTLHQYVINVEMPAVDARAPEHTCFITFPPMGLFFYLRCECVEVIKIFLCRY